MSEGFLAGTKVKTPTGHVAIEDLQVGDDVVCYNFCNACVVKKITHTIKRQAKTYVKIFLEGACICAEPDHQFYLPQEKCWLKARYITSSNILLKSCTEFVSIAYIQEINESAEVYDITVADYHNFCVSELDIHVHNVIPAIAFSTIGAAVSSFAFLGPFAGIAVFVGLGVALMNTARSGSRCYDRAQQWKQEQEQKRLLAYLNHLQKEEEARAAAAVQAQAEKERRLQEQEAKCIKEKKDKAAFDEACRSAWYQHQLDSNSACNKLAVETQVEDGVVVDQEAEEEQSEDEEEDDVKSVEDILKDAKPGEKTKRKSTQFEKPGSYEGALKDFEDLGLSNVRDIDKGKNKVKVGILSDGRKVNVRTDSSDERPTLEIQKPNGRNIKIRYGYK